LLVRFDELEDFALRSEVNAMASRTSTPGSSLTRTAAALKPSLYLFVVLGPDLGI